MLHRLALPAIVVGAHPDGKTFRERRQSAPLLILVQQLAHLINSERRILSIERFLTLTLVTKLAFAGKTSVCDF
jgi:hypothetical protein